MSEERLSSGPPAPVKTPMPSGGEAGERAFETYREGFKVGVKLGLELVFRNLVAPLSLMAYQKIEPFNVAVDYERAIRQYIDELRMEKVSSLTDEEVQSMIELCMLFPGDHACRELSMPGSDPYMLGLIDGTMRGIWWAKKVLLGLCERRANEDFKFPVPLPEAFYRIIREYWETW